MKTNIFLAFFAALVLTSLLEVTEFLNKDSVAQPECAFSEDGSHCDVWVYLDAGVEAAR